jgi:hypothetical protein
VIVLSLLTNASFPTRSLSQMAHISGGKTLQMKTYSNGRNGRVFPRQHESGYPKAAVEALAEHLRTCSSGITGRGRPGPQQEIRK